MACVDALTTEDEQSARNIQAFLAAAKEFGLSEKDLFSLPDIREGSWQDKPRVVECLYLLQRKAEVRKHRFVLKSVRFGCRWWTTDPSKTKTKPSFVIATARILKKQIRFTTTPP